jgi:hypothetical protein
LRRLFLFHVRDEERHAELFRPRVISNSEGENRVLKKRGKIERGLIVIGSAGGSIANLARGMWRGGPAERWMLPLAVFLCVVGLVLIVAASVEALAHSLP